ISNKMPIHINIEEDYLYQLGVKQAEELAREKLEEIRKQLVAKTRAAKRAIAKAEAKAEKAKAEAEARAKAEAEKRTAILNMHKAGISSEQIAGFFGIAVEEVQRYLGEQ
ncbi:MAG: hypothetical protein D6730_14850, partial [Bacteroidetes bacterium]